MPLGISVLGRRRKVSTREPGDLPSAVVTREGVGRGVQTLASPGCAGTGVSLVRCDVPLTSHRGRTMPFILKAERRRSRWLATGFLMPVLSLGISAAKSQQASPEQLPPIQVSPPVNDTRTRAN